MMDKIKPINSEFAVAAQLKVADLAEIKKMGYAAIVCNRPDGEEAEQVSSQSLATNARRLGLEFHYMPIANQQECARHVGQFTQLLTSLPKPIVAFCRTGTRSITLWALTTRANNDYADEDILVRAREAGYELTNVIKTQDISGQS